VGYHAAFGSSLIAASYGEYHSGIPNSIAQTGWLAKSINSRVNLHCLRFQRMSVMQKFRPALLSIF